MPPWPLCPYRSGQELLSLIGHKEWVSDIAFSSDGSLLLSTSNDATARLWDLETGEELLVLTENSAIREGAFSPDGKIVATGGGSDIKLWDAATGRELITLFEVDSTITGLEFSADGSRLLSSDYTGTVREFVLPLEELIELAKSRVTRSLTEDECRQYLHLDSCPDRP